MLKTTGDPLESNESLLVGVKRFPSSGDALRTADFSFTGPDGIRDTMNWPNL